MRDVCEIHRGVEFICLRGGQRVEAESSGPHESWPLAIVGRVRDLYVCVMVRCTWVPYPYDAGMGECSSHSLFVWCRSNGKGEALDRSPPKKLHHLRCQTNA